MKNRKKKERYKFVGFKSITDLTEELESLKNKLERNDNTDDPVWIQRWIKRIEREIVKKEKNLEHKKSQK